MNVEVLVELKAKNIDKTFTYAVPDGLIEEIEIGKRVIVPFGKQTLEGFVLGTNNDKLDYEVKDILSIVDENPILTEEMIKLGSYISKKTLSNQIHAYQAMLPTALKAKNNFEVKKKYTTVLVLVNNDPRTPAQKEILKLFEKEDEVKKTYANMISASAVKTLLKNECIKEITHEVYREVKQDDTVYQKYELTLEQRKISYEVLKSSNTFSPFLLHGVTGSGKTEIYMDIIEKVISLGKEVIVLVPEISLTPQFVSKFRNRFGDNIAILHSKLSNGEKYDEWRKIERKEVKIVIGARSAIFSPFQNLGLIVVDEEHSSTYKQESTPKYSAIDVALYRAKYNKIPLLLGSATPSVESYTRAKVGVYRLLELKSRVSGIMPEVNIVDMKKEIRKGNRIISEDLRKELNHVLDKGEQAIILLNRRGYSTVQTCKECGYTHKCPNCDIPLTYHKKTNSMKCHYCSFISPRLMECPECKSKEINSFGLGTEKLEEELNSMFGARIIRMDADTTSKKNAHQKIVKSFENKEFDILVGTQMIANGLDFENVTLVGVVNGDATLNIPDFRSAERTFELLTQVAGRAGRKDKPGKVIIQTFNDDHYSLDNVKKHDFISFYDKEMIIRKKLTYPPFCNLLIIKVTSRSEEEVKNEIDKVHKYLLSNLEKSVKILGPSPSNMFKFNNTYNMQILLKYRKEEEIKEAISNINNFYRTKKIKLDIDLNPYKI